MVSLLIYHFYFLTLKKMNNNHQHNINIILFDDVTRQNLFPLTFTRPVADIRIGIMTIREKWQHFFNDQASTLTSDYLREKYPLQTGDENIFINASILPNKDLVNEIIHLNTDEALIGEQTVIAIRTIGKHTPLLHKATGDWQPMLMEQYRLIDSKAEFIKINYLWDIYQYNHWAIQTDFNEFTKDRSSQPLSKNNILIGNPDNLFIEEGARVEGAIINVEKGQVYIGKNAEVMEGCLIRGPLAMCEHSVLKLGAKIYGATTLGPYSKAGGEVNNSVFTGYSNKAHDGFLGNSVIGEWCNIGADSNNSNLKNNYGKVKMWSYRFKEFRNSQQQFCGLFMADHSKCGINTMFNTGTVTGVCANVFGSGFPPKHIPSFAWGGADRFVTHNFDKAIASAQRMLERRNKKLDRTDIALLKYVYIHTSEYRHWEQQTVHL